MTTEGARPARPGPRTTALLDRAAALEEALAVGGKRIPAATTSAVRRSLAAVRERLALGVDHTVVALVGGTGSGKSSVFNALTGLEFADVGVRRPTTSQVTACVWAHDATALLDWLGVARDRRIERESELDGESQADLRGLVLLDLPDHDSIEPEHRAVVDRLLPLVDLLVWVVDPQKYADDALHSGYLRHLVGHEGAMLVVLNQIDTVPVHAQAGLLRDVSRLIEEDGLSGVGVHSVSARTGDGMPVLRGVLSRAVAQHSVAQVRATAELNDAARLLAGGVGPGEAARPPREETLDALADAVGLGSAVTLVEHGVRRGRAAQTWLGPVQRDRVAAIRATWLERTAHELPGVWRDSLARALPDHRVLSAAVDDVLTATPVRGEPPRSAFVLRVLAALLAVTGLVAGALLVRALVTDGADGVLLSASVLGGTVLLAAGSAVAAHLVLVRAAGRRAMAATEQVRTALAGVIEDQLATPSRVVLDEHRQVREAAVLEPVPTVPGRSSTGPADG